MKRYWMCLDDNYQDWEFCDYLTDGADKKALAASLFEIYTEVGFTDLSLDIFGQSSVVSSEKALWRGEKLGRTEENGEPVDYSDCRQILSAVTANSDGFSLTDEIFDLCAAHGIRGWIALRMNDCHFPLTDQKTSYIRDDFIYEAAKKGWMIDKNGTIENPYYGRCLDYAVPEVRRYFLDYIEEQLDRFGDRIAGIELDFMREICCFDFRNEVNRHAMMLDFMREVRAIADRVGEKYHKRLGITIDLCRSIEIAYTYGFDVVAMAKEGLIDAAVAIARWDITDSGMPMDEWKEALAPYGVDVLAGLEILHFDYKPVTVEVDKGLVVQYLDAGADGIYYRNHFSSTFQENAITNEEHDAKEWYRACASETMARRGVRRHLPTYEDIHLVLHPDENPWHPLPATIVDSGDLSVMTGKILPAEKVMIYLETDRKDIEVFFNGAPCRKIGNGAGNLATDHTRFRAPKQFLAVAERYLAFVPTEAASDALWQTVTVRAAGSVTVNSVEIKISETI